MTIALSLLARYSPLLPLLAPPLYPIRMVPTSRRATCLCRSMCPRSKCVRLWTKGGKPFIDGIAQLLRETCSAHPTPPLTHPARCPLPAHPIKIKDFYSKPCWAHHPKPYADFIDYKKKEREALEAERKKAVRV